MRVLIIKSSALGDIVNALPVINYIHQVSPGVEIDWVVEAPFIAVLEHNPLLANVYSVRTRVWRKKPFSAETRKALGELRANLQSRNYDMVIDLQGNLKSGLLSWISGTKKVVGYSSSSVQERINLFFTSDRVSFRPEDVHVMDRYLRIVCDAFKRDYKGIPIVTSITSAAEDEMAAENYISAFGGGPVFLFQIGTNWASRLWFPKGWIELAQKILSRYPASTILLNWGSTAEKTLGEEIIATVGERVRLLPWFSIRELIPVIRRVNIAIGADNGPIFIAAALGTPTITYYRSTDAARYAPRGEHHIAIQSTMSCTGCMLTNCNQNKDEECRRSITVDALMNATVKLMG